ncbi:MAG: antitoxin VbhA family protein [Prevotella sp.]|nr:antitoxin VbhA family protein [Prevotella sp.]
MALLEEYKNHPDESVRERTNNWAIAIGLQRVDGLNVSDFLIQVARQDIEGKITMDEAQILIDEHYAQTNSNRSSYEIVPPDSEESKRIAEITKPDDQNCINEYQ